MTEVKPGRTWVSEPPPRACAGRIAEPLFRWQLYLLDDHLLNFPSIYSTTRRWQQPTPPSSSTIPTPTPTRQAHTPTPATMGSSPRPNRASRTGPSTASSPSRDKRPPLPPPRSCLTRPRRCCHQAGVIPVGQHRSRSRSRSSSSNSKPRIRRRWSCINIITTTSSPCLRVLQRHPRG